MAVDPLHLRSCGFAMSEGFTIPLPQVRGAPVFGCGAGAGVAV